jgi:hypothetical protein
MSTRLTIYVEDDIPEKLLTLANGPRKLSRDHQATVNAALRRAVTIG